jgi:gluconokinase
VSSASETGGFEAGGCDPLRLVLMGVAGSGKTSVGLALAALVGARYLDGDDLHPPANIAKMAAGTALTDADRAPWLAAVGDLLAPPGRRIVGCSALKRSYRDIIRSHAHAPVIFVHLAGSRALIGARMAARQGHFMPESLLDSQFATLEPPGPEEGAITVDIALPLPDLVAAIAARLG